MKTTEGPEPKHRKRQTEMWGIVKKARAEIVTKSRKKLERSRILESCDEVCTLHVARKIKY